MEEADKNSDRIIRRVSSKSRRVALRARRENEESTSESEQDDQNIKPSRKLEHKTLASRNASQQKLVAASPKLELAWQSEHRFLYAVLGICHINMSFFHVWLAASLYHLQKNLFLLARTVQQFPQLEQNLASLSRSREVSEESFRPSTTSPQFAKNGKQNSEVYRKPKQAFVLEDLACESEDADYVSDYSSCSRPRKSTTELDMSMDESLTESSGRESGYLSGIDLSFLNRTSVSTTDSPAVSPQSMTLAQIGGGRLQNRFSLKKLKRGAVVEIVAKIPIVELKLAREPSVRGNTVTVSDSVPDFATSASFLQKSVLETKYVTAVFEMTIGGIDELFDDVLSELTDWFNGNHGLMGIACEIQWSVPEKYRNRNLERRMKDALHASLRENNLRVLNMKNNTGTYMPLTLSAAVTHENCKRDQKLNSFQGIYRRCYESLLPCQHAETAEWHKDYWSLEGTGGSRSSVPPPTPQQFIFGPNPTQLDRGSLIALNVIALKLMH